MARGNRSQPNRLIRNDRAGDFSPLSLGRIPSQAMVEITLRYRWRPTWDDGTKNDFLAFDVDVVIGRMHLTYVSPQRWHMWQWALHSLHGLSAGQLGGMIDGTAREAARFLEAHYDAMVPLSEGIMLRPAKREVAFYERKGLPVPERVLRRVERGL